VVDAEGRGQVVITPGAFREFVEPFAQQGHHAGMQLLVQRDLPVHVDAVVTVLFDQAHHIPDKLGYPIRILQQGKELLLPAEAQQWAGLDFDRPQDAVDAYATQFDYLKQGGKMALAPSMIEKAHAAGARILLCFGGQQEFLPLLENPDRIAKFVEANFFMINHLFYIQPQI